MARLKRIAIALFAAATVTIGTLGTAPAVSALPRSCDVVQPIINSYWATGWAYYSIGAYSHAYYWWGRADQLAAGGCV